MNNDPILKTRILALESDLRKLSLNNFVRSDLRSYSEGDDKRKGFCLLKNRRLDELEISIAGSYKREVNLLLKNELNELSKVHDNNSWRDFTNCSEKSSEFFYNWVELLGGFLIRDWGLDYAISDIADNMISLYAANTTKPWMGITLPSHDRILCATLLRIIRLPFQQWTLWTLPVVAHEYAHVLASESDTLHSYEPIRIELNDFKEKNIKRLEGHYGVGDATNAKAKEWIEELFSDIFATYVMGPAYAYTAVMLILNPIQEMNQTPTGIERSIVILKTLENMNFNNNYDGIIDNLEEKWDFTVKCANPAGWAQDLQEKQYLTDFSDRIFDFLENDGLSLSKYPPLDMIKWSKVIDLAEFIREGLNGKKGSTLPNYYESYQLVDVLNAAWVCRLHRNADQKEDNSQKAAAIKKQALEICMKIIVAKSQTKVYTEGGISKDPEV
jgi:hypothetical protein